MPSLIGSWAMAPAGSRSAAADTEAMSALFMDLLPFYAGRPFASPPAACTQSVMQPAQATRGAGPSRLRGVGRHIRGYLFLRRGRRRTAAMPHPPTEDCPASAPGQVAGGRPFKGRGTLPGSVNRPHDARLVAAGQPQRGTIVACIRPSSPSATPSSGPQPRGKTVDWQGSRLYPPGAAAKNSQSSALAEGPAGSAWAPVPSPGQKCEWSPSGPSKNTVSTTTGPAASAKR
jgi:hypothetical protein